MARKQSSTDAVLEELRAFGMTYPGVHFMSPWPGHMDLAVKGKTFAYLSLEGEPLGISCKLPQSNGVALLLPFCTPTGYGLGKSGWVSASFADHEPDVEMLKAWIDESYRAQAPKTLVKQIGMPVTLAPAEAKKKPVAKKAAANKTAAKKTPTKSKKKAPAKKQSR